STYESEGGRIRNVPPEVLSEVLRAWENWPGTSKEFYTAIGVSQKQMAVLIGKAKKLKREGYFPAEEFEAVGVVGGGSSPTGGSPCSGIELSWSEGRVIRFPEVDSLIEFLKKAS